jgi:hypothetical protein
MALQGGSKQTLDTPKVDVQPSPMRMSIAPICGLLLLPGAARAQAPAWADLWRVAEGTLVRPAALAEGPTGTFWNPAAVVSANGPAFGVDVYQTPDIVNVSSVLLAAGLGLWRRAGVGVLAGRADVGDLVRTSTSPIVDGPEIPVYAQFAGAVAGGRIGPFEGGATLLFHDARLDALGAGGVTLDVGIRLRPLRGLAIGAATHLGEPVATTGAASEYLAGIEYDFGIPPVIGLSSRLQLRYGFATRERASADHVGSVGLLLAERLLIDAGVQWTGGYGIGSWQPVLGVAYQAGPFRVGIARGSGASDIGATYRITLGVNGAP